MELSGGNCPWWELSSGNCLGGNRPGGNCPGANSPGGNCPGGKFQWGNCPGENYPEGIVLFPIENPVYIGLFRHIQVYSIMIALMTLPFFIIIIFIFNEI